MKKSKLSITLVTSFIAAMALTACNEVTKSDNAIVNFTPYGSSESIALITDSMYNKYRGTNNGISMFYDKILEVLIRYHFQAGFDKGDMKEAEIIDWAENQVQEQKETAKNNAKSNNTSYDDEWDAILESHNVEDEEELKQQFIYNKEKEVITNWYAGDKDKAEDLKNEFIGINENGEIVQEKLGSKVAGALPYHIRHILVKVDEASDAQAKFYKGTVTEAQAKLLSDTVTTLASGKYTFSEVAKMYSEDTSGASGGDVGIMTNDATSGSLGMVNEFQLGLYAYDNLYTDNKNDAAAAKIQEKLGITDTAKADLPASFAEVPYEAFVKIGKYADVTTDKYGNKLANGSATLYPRNIIWNKYFNLHNVFLIKKSAVSESKFGANNAADEFNGLNLTGGDYATTAPKFDAQGYLVDDHGNRIIGVRSQYGIHFMIIEKSVYDYKSRDGRSTLAQYYSTYIPDDGPEKFKEDSYVGYIVSQSSEDYKKRADDVKSKITSFDPTYDYRLYNYLKTQVNINFTGKAEHLGEDIDKYIEVTQDNNLYKQADGLEKVWRTYNELLDVQDYNRAAKFDTINTKGQKQENLTRLVSEQAADDFIALYEGTIADPGVADDPLTPDVDEAAEAYAKAYADLYAKFAEGGCYYYYA